MSKADSGAIAHSSLHQNTKVTVGGRNPHAHHGYVNTPVYHASTLLYQTVEGFLGRKGRYSHGRRGTPTSEALEQAIQTIEGPACAAVALLAFPNALSLYGMGASWGGFESLAIPCDVSDYRTAALAAAR